MPDAYELDLAEWCVRCGKSIDPQDSFVVKAADGSGMASMCRLEHIVAWVIRGAGWQTDPPSLDKAAVDERLILVRHRAGTVSEREFESPKALQDWASAGGEWSGG